MAIQPNDRLVNNIKAGFCALSHIHGTGLFARHHLVPGEVIGLLGGSVIPWTDYFIMGPEYFVDKEWNALTSKTLLVRDQKTKYCAINHSRSGANLFLDRLGPHHAPTSIQIRVIQAIEPNEEMLLNYLEEPLPDTYRKMHGWMYL